MPAGSYFCEVIVARTKIRYVIAPRTVRECQARLMPSFGFLVWISELALISPSPQLPPFEMFSNDTRRWPKKRTDVLFTSCEVVSKYLYAVFSFEFANEPRIP
jgi:hypothetical protein